MDRAEQAARNRALMPEFSAFVDEIRRMDPGAVVVHVEGNGVVLGKARVWDGMRSMNAVEWVHWVTTGEVPRGKASPWARAQ